MIDFRDFKQTTCVAMMVVLLGIAMAICAQTSTPVSGADQINNLLASLSHHSRSPADVLDPTLSVSDRQKNIKRFSALHYELSLVPTDGIPATTGESVSVPIRVHFDAKDGNSLDTNATAQFVKRGDIWYFANFDFMSWSVFLIIILVLGVLVGIGYAATIFILGNKLLKHGPLGFNRVKMFFPFFWPSLFRQAR
jgi:Flp pilus assembly protein TadB